VVHAAGSWNRRRCPAHTALEDHRITSGRPHLQAAKTKAQFLIAIAANDDARSPNDKTALKETFAKANLPAEIEVNAGAMNHASGRPGGADLEPGFSLSS
jgi:dienelactone hydrolase